MRKKPTLGIQGAGFDLNRGVYEMALQHIHPGGSVLNLGSGIAFNFEKIATSQKKLKVTCVDIYVPRKLPKYVSDFKVQNVEDEFLLDKKFDTVTFFELIEHIDKTDTLLINCYNNLKDDGLLIFSFPNLSSIYGRLELLLGYQPHVLEVSNLRGPFGMGIFGKINYPWGSSLHHIRGITTKAMKELLEYHNFSVVNILGYSDRLKGLFKLFPYLAPLNVMVCKKVGLRTSIKI